MHGQVLNKREGGFRVDERAMWHGREGLIVPRRKPQGALKELLEWWCGMRDRCGVAGGKDCAIGTTCEAPLPHLI